MNPLQKIMNPQSIVVIGASNNFMKMGTLQALNLIKGDFKGQVMFMHPSEKTVLGFKAFKQAKDLPIVPDLALLITPTKVTVGLVDELGEHGVRHAIIVTAGFREVGADGKRLEKKLLEVARKHKMRFVGPNCIGVINNHIGLNVTIFPYHDKPGHLGVISQSGTYVTQNLPYLRTNGIRISQAISVGNASNIDVVDALYHMGDDKNTKAVALYIEGINRGREFIKAAKYVARKKPVVALYVGGSTLGARSGMSHTGSLGGSDILLDGAFTQAGVIRVKTVQELFAFGQTLAEMPVLKGRKVAILTHSGGPATSMSDACEKCGLKLPEFSDSLKQKIAKHIEATASAKNPVDLTFTLDQEVLIEKIPKLLFESDEIDGLLMHGVMDTGFINEVYQSFHDVFPLKKEQLLAGIESDLNPLFKIQQDSKKPLTASTFLQEDHAHDEFLKSNVPLFTTPEQAVYAMAALADYADILRRKGIDDDFDSDIIKLNAKNESGKKTMLDEYEAGKLLASYNIPIAKQELVSTFEDAVSFADKIGYPLVLKGMLENTAHKTEAGLVKLNLHDKADLLAAWNEIECVAPNAPRLLSKMLKGEREFSVGMARFDAFGPAIMLGLGGIFAEALSDVTFRVVPVSYEDALSMHNSLKNKKMFSALRGLPEVDKSELAKILLALSQIAIEHPEISEIDINPLIACGSHLFAADALVIISKED